MLKWLQKSLKNLTFRNTWPTKCFYTLYKIRRAPPLDLWTSGHETIQYRLNKLIKICLSAYDDKRYLMMDGVSSLAHGHKDILWTHVLLDCVDYVFYCINMYNIVTSYMTALLWLTDGFSLFVYCQYTVLYWDVLDWDIILCLLYWIESLWTCVVLLVVLLVTLVSTMCWCMDLYVCNKRWNVLKISLHKQPMSHRPEKLLTQHMSDNKAEGHSKTDDTA